MIDTRTGFAYLEGWHAHWIANKSEDLASWLLQLTDTWKAELSLGGYEWDAVDFFYEPLHALLGALPTLTSEDLLARFNDEETSNGMIVVLRLLCSAYMKTHPDLFTPFLEDGYIDLADFCQRDVDAFGVESGELQIIGTVNALKMPCSVHAKVLFSIRFTNPYL